MTPIYPSKAVDVAIVGAGPVGLTASLLLSRFHVHHLVVENRLEPSEHPQAHFVSCRSMEKSTAIENGPGDRRSFRPQLKVGGRLPHF